jgi:hypothetical protein
MKATAAREVLRTTENALELFDELDPMGARWRVIWTAAISLLRSVGHTLDKVDRGNGPELSAAIDDAWAVWGSQREEHAIFWFIDDARNLVLKEGTTYRENGRGSVGQSITVRIGSGHRVGYPVYDTRFPGIDQKELLTMAVRWWHDQLDLIETDASDRAPVATN